MINERNDMKVVEVKCLNASCANFNKYTLLYLEDFIWDVEWHSGANPADLFLEMPVEIRCQNCLNLCDIQIKEL